MSDPQRPHGLQPTRLLCPWDFPGKSTEVGCHCLLQEYYSGLLFPTPEDFPDTGIKPVLLVSPALVGGFFTSTPPGKPQLA